MTDQLSRANLEADLIRHQDSSNWVLPYDHHQYLLLRKTQMVNQQVLTWLETKYKHTENAG